MRRGDSDEVWDMEMPSYGGSTKDSLPEDIEARPRISVGLDIPEELLLYFAMTIA